MAKSKQSEGEAASGIQPLSGRRLARQIARTQKMSIKDDDEAIKYWFRPRPPQEQESMGLVDPAKLAQQQAEDAEPVPALLTADSVGAMLADATEFAPVAAEPAVESEPPSETEPEPEPDAVETTGRALVIRETADAFTENIEVRTLDEFPAGDVLIRVEYSSLNYKDALCATGFPGIARQYPIVPGVDVAGLVEESSKESVKVGNRVLVTGFGLGTDTDGGFAEYVRVPVNWTVPCPPELDAKQAMTYGTAGLTAALCVRELMNAGIRPNHGKVLVTGATGGVGSIAVGILAAAGYTVTAATGKAEQGAYLMDLGAAEIVPREEVQDTSGRPMLHSRWAGAVDTVGGEILSTVIRQLQYGGAIACCGMVAGADLSTSVYPFILRGIRVVGVDSVNCSRALRTKVWDKLGNEWQLPCVERAARECSLEELPSEINRILKGEQVGRVVVRPKG